MGNLRGRRGGLAVLAAGAVAAGMTIPAADAGNGVVKSFGSQSDNPALGGTLATPRGVAVNAAGNGGVAPGTVYVVDGANNRIGRFDDAGAFVSTWGQDVVQADGPGDAGTGFEVCAASDTCKAGTTGPWGGALNAPRGVAVDESTGHLYVTDNGNRVQQFTATGSFVRAWGAGVVGGGATGTGTLANSSTSVTAVTATSKAFAVGQPIAGPGIQPGTTIAGVSATGLTLSKATTANAAGTAVPLTVAVGAGNVGTDERQTVTLGANTTGGTFALSYATLNPSGTTAKTSAIASNASAATVQAALEALPTVGAGNVAVTGSAGGPWTVTFQGTRFADTDVNQMTSDPALLTVSSGNRTATVATVTVGASAAEICTAALECATAKSASGPGQFLTTSALTQPAVGPSGSVFVPDAGNARVQEFSAAGAFVRAWSGSFAANHPTALAVDSTGNVYAADGANARVRKFGPTGTPISTFVPGGTNAPAATGYNLAVDRSTDHVLVGSTFASPTERRVEEFSSAGALLDTHVAGAALADIGGIGVHAGSGSLFLSTTTDGSRVVVAGRVVPPQAAIAPVTAVGARTATFNGTVTPPGGGMATRYRFEYSTDGSGWERFPGVDVSVGTAPSPVAVHQDVTGLVPSTHYLVRLVATIDDAAGTSEATSTVELTTDAAPPLVVETGAGDVGQSAATLRAKVDPGNQATGYHFEWGETDSYGQRAPSFEPAIAGSGLQAVEQPVDGLEPDTTYHFRVVATNAAGTTEGPDQVLHTLNPAGLPAGRGYELVSPGGGAGLQAAADGQSLVWSPADEDGAEQLATRDPDGWTSTPLAAGDYRYFSDDLSCGVLTSADSLYRRGADGSLTLLAELEPTGAVGSSGDCGHVVFETPSTYPGLGASGLYEWDHGTLRNAGVRPDGSVATGAVLGASSGRNAWNAVSTDGSRIVFSATGNEGGDAGKAAVFVREDGASTVKASASKTAVPNRGAVYQLASKTGRHVLFLANYGLTASTSAGPVGGNCELSPPLHCDLYDYDVETGELTDLSVDTVDPGGAMVAGVLGASDDASYVYFAARGQLIPGEGRTVAANFASGSYNVYLAHGGERSFVGLLRTPEVVAHGTGSGALVARSTATSSPWASRVTPDGRHLLFPSSAAFAGYDSGGVVEAYLYSADADTTICVSCRRDGQPSVGVPTSGDAPTVPLASDGSAGHRYPLHPPRSLSADGSRVFFEMPDALAPGAAEGGDNLYAWESGQVSLLAAGSARFEDASADGDDVFVSTRDALLPQDVDDDLDVYGVRVDGGLPWTPPPACVPPAPGCPDVVVPPVLPPVLPPPPRSPRATFAVRGLTAAQRARLVAGKRVGLAVRVSGAGRVSVRGVAGIGGKRRVVFAASRRAARAGTVRLPLRLPKPARARIAKVGALRVSTTVSFSAVRRKVTRSIVFRRSA